MRPHLDEGVAANERRVGTLVKQLQKRVPLLVEVGSELGGAFGGGIDALPVYHLLGARLVAEACVKGLVVEAPIEEPPPDPVAENEAEPDDPFRDVALRPHRTIVGRQMAMGTPTQEPATRPPVSSSPPAPAHAPPEVLPPVPSPVPPPVPPTPARPEAPAPQPEPPRASTAARPEVPPPTSPVSPPSQPAVPPAGPRAGPRAGPPAPPSRPPPQPVAPKPSAKSPPPAAAKVSPAKPTARPGGGGLIVKILLGLGCAGVLGCTGLVAIGGAGSLLALVGFEDQKPRKVYVIQDPSQQKKR